jgi:hypothetical protein
MGFGQCLQELFGLIHAVFSPSGLGCSRRRIVPYLLGIVQRGNLERLRQKVIVNRVTITDEL